MYNQYHKAIDGITRHRTKKEFATHITNMPLNQQQKPVTKKQFQDQVKSGVILHNSVVEGQYAVERSGTPGVTTSWGWRVLSYDQQYQSFLARKPKTLIALDNKDVEELRHGTSCDL